MEGVSAASDDGTSYMLKSTSEVEDLDGKGGLMWLHEMENAVEKVVLALFGESDDEGNPAPL